ncbi:glycosyltransferase [Arcobacter arenosus]|uniref:Glycosyltransferase n=1 Tax=Arcobacter arenosus TaxID=2576037 RepID=A0A5R8XYK3_9BACT|nr:glycosyltransferase [Arcobacter arenosus]TLP36821.1 glycosyltransferase [Arcobacter arenosus]
MKILMIIPSLSKKWGGTTSSLKNFYYGLNKINNVKCSVLATYTQKEYPEIDENILNDSNFKLFEAKKEGWRYSKELNSFLNKNLENFDLVWIHTIWTSIDFFVSKYSKKFKKPYTITPHGMLDPIAFQRKGLKKKIYWSLIEKNIFYNCSAIHAITNKEYSDINKLSKQNKFVIPNGLQNEEFLNKNYTSLNSIAFIGRFHEIKALDLLLKSLVNIKNLNLIIAGAGEKDYEEYIYNLVKELKLESRVIFKGFANAKIKKEIFEKSLFLVLPSHTEGLSMVGLEAIMNSTPVLTTEKCNFNEVQEYNAGMVMKNNHPETISKYINMMLDSDLKKMSKNAHNLALERFSIDSVSKKIYKEFEKIINETSKPK